MPNLGFTFMILMLFGLLFLSISLFVITIKKQLAKKHPKKNKFKPMPNYDKEYRITEKNGRYRLEMLNYEKKWTILNKPMDDLYKAKKLKKHIVNDAIERWKNLEDYEGWTAVEVVE